MSYKIFNDRAVVVQRGKSKKSILIKRNDGDILLSVGCNADIVSVFRWANQKIRYLASNEMSKVIEVYWLW